MSGAALRGLFAHEERRLPNSMRVLLSPRPGLQRASLALYIRVGSRFESPLTNGLSHFLEHMLYRGIPRHPTAHAQALAFERLGGTPYAATATDHGLIHLSLPSESLLPALDLLGEMLTQPLFSRIDTERGIIEEEIREDLDDEGRQIDPDNLSRDLLYPDHPLGYTITGSLEQLRSYDEAALRAHHARHYTAANMVAVLAGNFDRDPAFLALEKAFSGIPKGSPVEAEKAPPLPGRPRFRYVDSDGSQTDLRVAFRGPGDGHPDEPAMELLLRIIDDGMSTRLYERLCDEKGLCYDVSAATETFSDDGLFDMAAESQHERAAVVVREILDLCREMAEHGPTEQEVDVARDRLAWSTRALLDSPEDLAAFYGLSALAGTTPTPDARAEQILAVTREQVRSVARSLFRPERLGVVAVGLLPRAIQREIDRITKKFG